MLATLPGARLLEKPATVTTGPPDGPPEGSDPTFGVPDSLGSVKVRKESKPSCVTCWPETGHRQRAHCAAASTRWGS